MSKETDIWMPIVIGDYLKDTQHLDAERHGCYLLWLLHYWIKGPLPNSIQELTLLGRLRNPDAPSIAHALLAEFFTLERDGMYHQKRADIEKVRWNGKRQAAQEKAVTAAKARWKNHASSITPSNAQAMPEDMHTECPSPSPSPKSKRQRQNPSRAKKQREEVKTKTEVVNVRHQEFKSAIEEYWKSKNTGVEMPWGPAEGKELGMWLSQSPKTNIDQFRQYLRHRYKSEVNHADRPSLWIRNITSYANGPLNQYKKPIGGNLNGRPTKQEQSTSAFEQVRAELHGLDSRRTEGHSAPDAGTGHPGMHPPDDARTDRH